jgi:hypothetical protein
MAGTLHEDLSAFIIIFRPILLRLRNVLDKFVKKITTRILFSVTFSRRSCCLWDNVEKYDTAREATGDNIIRLVPFACWITKATDTHSEYVTFVAFPHQCLRKRSLLSRCTYIACLVHYSGLWILCILKSGCGAVVLWCCSAVLWCCSAVLWCGAVVLWCCGAVVL